MKPFRPIQANLQSNLGEIELQTRRFCSGDRASSAGPAPGDQVAQAQGDVLERGGGGERKVGRRPQGGDPSRHQVPAEIIATAERHAVTKNPDLIDALVERATPVRRLRPPLVRAGPWLAFASLILALLAIGHGVRADLGGAPASARLRRQHRGRARRRNPRGRGGVHRQPARPLAGVAAAPRAGPRRVASAPSATAA